MIQLFDGYAIDADTSQFILGRPQVKQYTDKKTGETKSQTVWNDATYHTTLCGAVIAYRKRKERELVAEKAHTLETFLRAITAFDDRMKELLPEYELVRK